MGLLLAATAATAEITENNPRLALPESRLHRTHDAPIFITGQLGVGGGFQYEHGQVEYGAALIFRPGSAADFLDFLYGLNSAMVLQLDRQQLAPGSRILSGDLIIRHYLSDRGQAGNEVLPFVGIGFGASDLILPVADGGGGARYWSWLVEVGQEWYFRPHIVLVARAQYRHFSQGVAFATTWTVSGGIGLPVPW